VDVAEIKPWARTLDERLPSEWAFLGLIFLVSLLFAFDEYHYVAIPLVFITLGLWLFRWGFSDAMKAIPPSRFEWVVIPALCVIFAIIDRSLLPLGGLILLTHAASHYIAWHRGYAVPPVDYY